MILIDTSTLQLRHVPELRQTPYAILSHTWGDDEVNYKDFSNLEEAKSKSGYDKIVRTCQLAAARGLEYVWIDTCCIDKSSSAELTEAINSMFRWYREAEVCFAYISDLPERNGGPAFRWIQNGHYRWFTRGWTLQELVAADKVEFYDAGWEYRGDKAALISQICRITGVDEHILEDSKLLPATPVARKMSWAAGRETTRTEDMAYCLLGLFNINMPLIYGEGERAFIRLQEETAKETNDLSLFAWTSKDEHESESFTGLFARSPQEFAQCRNILRWSDFLAPRPEFTITNNGVRLETSLGREDDNEFVLDLGCCDLTAGEERLGIYLHQAGSRFLRKRPDTFYRTQDSRVWLGEKSTIYVPKRLSPEEKQRLRLELASRIYVRFSPGYEIGHFSVVGTARHPESLWNIRERYFLTMDSVAWQSPMTGTIYPPFIGIYGFRIRDTFGRHICNCLLVCGIFQTLSGNELPCAVVYADADPSTEDVFMALAEHKGEADGSLLSYIRDCLISDFSPNGTTLQWDDISDREVHVVQDGHVLHIQPEIRLVHGISVSDEDKMGYSTSPNVERTDIDNRGQDIASLPDNYSGERQYVVSVCISRDQLPEAEVYNL
ncbi:hypothetical protein INS49_010541 [Diaporthe citri]|uniref:uncharacterized protein n=1 Tax=Diaporthe citri TaxID=83186 RepID=UPI001C7EF9E0|nr:uncharacterized protein INS49_010541 [Diaporthe citri]KAG6362311.1 hypothetical protein INS49_010541 [Diaporthe citri]